MCTVVGGVLIFWLVFRILISCQRIVVYLEGWWNGRSRGWCDFHFMHLLDLNQVHLEWGLYETWNFMRLYETLYETELYETFMRPLWNFMRRVLVILVCSVALSHRLELDLAGTRFLEISMKLGVRAAMLYHRHIVIAIEHEFIRYLWNGDSLFFHPNSPHFQIKTGSRDFGWGVLIKHHRKVNPEDAHEMVYVLDVSI